MQRKLKTKATTSGRLGIIDLGTNSVRFDVQEVKPRTKPTLLHREKLMVRLGENLFLTGRLSDQAIKRTLQAFRSFKRTADEFKVHKIVAFGTSALRDAKDSDRLVRAVREELGIEIHVISGEEEARLIATGVLAHESRLKGLFALVDIGGGSTEISICRGRKVSQSRSFPLGAARLQQIYLKESPPKKGKDAVLMMRHHIQNELRAAIKAERWPEVRDVLGSSGTVRALARISRKMCDTKSIEREWLSSLVQRMTPMLPEQLKNIPGMEIKRIDLILSGAIVLEECMRALGAKKALATEWSLRDGIVEQEMRLFHQQRFYPIERDLSALFEKAHQFGVEPHRAKRLTQISEVVFHGLRRLHRIESSWLAYLQVAALFRRSGRKISAVGQENHSYYIVRNSDLPFSQSWETQFVAELCRRLEDEKFERSDLELSPPNLNLQRSYFLKLLALLRLVDAVDSTTTGEIPNLRFRFTKSTVEIRVGRTDATELALLRLHQQRDMFQRVFRKTLVARK